MSDPNASEPVAPLPASSDGPAVPPDARPQYEFDDAQNETINNLAMAILWVRLPLMIAAVLQGLTAIGLAFRIHKDGAHIIGVFGYLLSAVICYLLATWLIKAAAAFVRVTTTSGRDISHLMTGLKNLGSWFDLLAFFVKLYLILLGVILLMLVIGLVAGAFKGSA